MTDPAPAVHTTGPLSRALLTEPVRLWLYGVTLAAVALLVSYGLLTDAAQPLWEALAAAVLAVPVVETVRSNVYSPRTTLQLISSTGVRVAAQAAADRQAAA